MLHKKATKVTCIIYNEIDQNKHKNIFINTDTSYFKKNSKF